MDELLDEYGAIGSWLWQGLANAAAAPPVIEATIAGSEEYA